MSQPPIPKVPSTVVAQPVVDKDGRPTAIMKLHLSGVSQATNLIAQGFTGTISTAPLTGGGTNGSMTFQNGVLIESTPAS
jgi:hypothetical protein